MKREWLIQFFGNALLLFLFYEWLGIRDSRISQIVLSFALGLGIFAGLAFLHSRTFHVRPARFALGLLIFLVLWWGISLVPLSRGAQWIASMLTFQSRKPVSPALVLKLCSDVRWFVQWLVIPILLLRVRRLLTGLLFVLFVLIGFLAPGMLIHWTPKLESTPAQVTSFVLRFGFAYCLLITSCAAFARFTSPGMPAASQPRTAALP